MSEQWLAAFHATAEEHIDRARRAEDEGRFVCAVDAYADASLWHHYTACVPYPDRSAYLAAEEQAADALRKSLAISDSTVEYIDGRNTGNPFVGLLQRSANAEHPPVAIIIAGLDSSKEEFQAVAREFIRRGWPRSASTAPGKVNWPQVLFYFTSTKGLPMRQSIICKRAATSITTAWAPLA